MSEVSLFRMPGASLEAPLAGGNNGFRGVERPATGKCRHGSKQCLLGCVEQVDAALQGSPQRLLARRRVLHRRGRQRQATAETL
jgi:hypothetical protein